jgi:hypothetical protein
MGRPNVAGKYTDCAQGHSRVRISGKDDNEFVANVQAHLKSIHSSMPLPSREQILAMAKTA